MLVRCGVCDKTKPEHTGMAHRFSPGGQLIVEAPKEQVKVISGIDVALRLLLIDKGIITGEELMLKEAALREQLAKGANAHQRQDPKRTS